MTLREKIEQAADKYTDNANTFIEYSDDGGWSDKNDIEYVEKAYKVGAEYGYNLAIEKATKWLEEHQEDFNEYDAWKGEYIDFKELIKDLKETMKL